MSPVDRTNDRAVYRQIADELRDAIRSGHHQPGERLPSETELASNHGVNRRTVQNAYQLLITEGLARAEHGAGHFVVKRPRMRRLGFDRFARQHRQAGKSAFTVDVERSGREYDVATDVHMLHLGPAEPSPEIAARLDTRTDTVVAVRSRCYVVEEQPVQVATSYVPMDIAQGTAILEPDSGPGGIYARIEDAGHRLTRFTEDIRVVVAPETQARILKLSPGTSVIRLVRCAFADTRVVEVCEVFMNPSAFELSYELPA